MSSFQDLQQRAMDIRIRYNQLNKEHGHVEWDGKAYAMGLVGDTGDLLKLVMAKENFRTLSRVDDIDAALRHEIADCLWSLMVIAHEYEVDLGQALLDTMDELDARIDRGQE